MWRLIVQLTEERQGKCMAAAVCVKPVVRWSLGQLPLRFTRTRINPTPGTQSITKRFLSMIMATTVGSSAWSGTKYADCTYVCSFLGHPYEGHGRGYGGPGVRIHYPQKTHQLPGDYHIPPRMPVPLPDLDPHDISSDPHDISSDVKVRNGAPINGVIYGQSRQGNVGRGMDSGRGGFGGVYGGMDTQGEKDGLFLRSKKKQKSSLRTQWF